MFPLLQNGVDTAPESGQDATTAEQLITEKEIADIAAGVDDALNAKTISGGIAAALLVVMIAMKIFKRAKVKGE